MNDKLTHKIRKLRLWPVGDVPVKTLCLNVRGTMVFKIKAHEKSEGGRHIVICRHCDEITYTTRTSFKLNATDPCYPFRLHNQPCSMKDRKRA